MGGEGPSAWQASISKNRFAVMESGQATIAWSEGPVELRGESDCLCLCLSVSLSLFFVCVGESRAPAQRRGEEG